MKTRLGGSGAGAAAAAAAALALAAALGVGLAAPAAARAAAGAAGDPRTCVLTQLSKWDEGPTVEALAACGGDVAGELLWHASGNAPNGLVRGRALLYLPLFAPDEAVSVLRDVLADPTEHAYFRARAIAAAGALADAYPDAVLEMVTLALGAAADPYVRERAIDTALLLPGKAALETLKRHRVRERARWLMPKLKSAVAALEARP
ncbi:MAG TPA: hypothetical protein VG389_17950 [Myxococcota bacterium]|jgi:hypothetical protein|nr:hypothetical protein [Myxococcota bacterium]